MSTETTPTPTRKASKARAPKAPRQPRAVDPQIAAIKEEAKRKLAELRTERRGKKILMKILALLPRLSSAQLQAVDNQIEDEIVMARRDAAMTETDPAAAITIQEA